MFLFVLYGTRKIQTEKFHPFYCAGDRILFYPEHLEKGTGVIKAGYIFFFNWQDRATTIR